VFLQAGAGIVADSVPENEYHETEHKLGPMKAVFGADQGDSA
jgi:anthranilate/para-aminobenzoate synthase component I